MLLQIFLLFITILSITEQERIITTIKYSTFRVTPTIVHGNPVLKGQVPFLVSIKEPVQKVSKKKILWSNLCGGSIIGPVKVLTAAHCFEGKHFYYAKHYHQLRVVAGNLQNEIIHTGRTETTRKAQWRSLTKVTLHKEFQFPSNDIALVLVDSNFKYTSTVDYVIPARKLTDYPRTCMAAGFGQTGAGPQYNVSKELMWADIYILSRRQCDIWWEMNMDTFVCTNSQVTDVGGGDSGGPLACYGTLDKAEMRGRDLLVGIVSGKNYDKTTLFTRVSAYSKWLSEDGSSSLCVPSKLLVCTCSLIIFVYIRLLILFICRHIVQTPGGQAIQNCQIENECCIIYQRNLTDCGSLTCWPL